MNQNPNLQDGDGFGAWQVSDGATSWPITCPGSGMALYEFRDAGVALHSAPFLKCQGAESYQSRARHLHLRQLAVSCHSLRGLNVVQWS